MKMLARVAIGLAVVAAVAVVGVVVAIKTIDPNTLIAPVKAQVKAATGRDLEVRGGASIALSLHPRIVLNDVVLSNAPWGVARELAHIERLELATALLPLFSRRFELTRVVLVKPVVALEADGKGQKNWQPPGAPAAGSSGAGGGLAAAVAIGDIEISDGLVTWRDGPKGVPTRLSIAALSLRSQPLRSNVAVDFTGAVGDTRVKVAGDVGAFTVLLARTSAYPVDLRGEVAGQKFAIAARITTQPRYVFDDLKLALGENAVSGTLAVDTAGARPKATFDLRAPAVALQGVPIPATPAAPVAANPGRSTLIPDTQLSFAPLRLADADGKLAIDKLTLASGRQLGQVRLAFTLDNGKLDVSSFSVAAFGGTLRGSTTVDASRGDDAAVRLRLDADGLALGAVLAALGQAREVRGGTLDVDADLTMRGNSPHEWASTASGSFRAVSGKATLTNAKVDAAIMIDRLTEAINPFRTRDPSTDLVCAVVRLPLRNGVANVDRSIAIETDKIGVSASGTLDFRNETLDLTFQPKVRKGISIDFAGLADLVRLRGPFASPSLAVDVAGSAKVIASVGAAIGTGGISAVAQGLLSWADGAGPGPCRVAMDGGAPPTAASAKGADPAAAIGNEVGKALGKLFGR
jgi:uncharacterized protein involved in outer membrane biogenesis